MKHVLIAVAVLALVGNLALAQAPANSIEGQLTRVDSESMSLIVTALDGSEHQFKYDTETEITGTRRSSPGWPRSPVRRSSCTGRTTSPSRKGSR